MAWIRCTGNTGGSLKVRTASGAIATFETNMADVLQEVKCEINATGGNGTPDNPNPINGYSSANITRCGVNLMHVDSRVSQTTASVTYTSDDNYIYLNGVKNGGGYADMSNLTMTLPRGTYYLKAFVISGTASNTVSLYAFDGTNNISPDILGSEKSMTLNNTTTFRFRFAIWKDGTVCTNYKVGIVISTASISEYSEYTGDTVTIAFGQTIYGGVLDVTRGKLNVTWGEILLDETASWLMGTTPTFRYFNCLSMEKLNVDAWKTNVISNMFGQQGSYPYCQINGEKKVRVVFDINDTSVTSVADLQALLLNENLQVIYPLATPFDIDLTPVQIEQLLGKNNVWHDGNGDTEVKYLEVVRN